MRKLNGKRLLIGLGAIAILYPIAKIQEVIGSRSTPASTPASAPSPSPTASPRPPIPPAMLALGQKVAAQTKATSTAWGTGLPGTYALTVLPKSAWKKLSKTEKAALTYYAEDQVAIMKRSPADFMGKMPITAPGYDKAVWRVKLMCDTCWVLMVGNSTIPPYGTDETVVQGEAVWDKATTQNESLGQRSDRFRAAMLQPLKLNDR
jgi:hypothetical protein